MTGNEAIQACLEGKKVRRPGWYQDTYVWLLAGRFVWSDGCTFCASWLGDNWQLYEDQPPRPTEEQLLEWGMVIDGEEPRVPCIGDYYAGMDGNGEVDCCAEYMDSGKGVTRKFGFRRWILKPDPYAEFKRAEKAGKVVQLFDDGKWCEPFDKSAWDYTEPPDCYRIKPEPEYCQPPLGALYRLKGGVHYLGWIDTPNPMDIDWSECEWCWDAREAYAGKWKPCTVESLGVE